MPGWQTEGMSLSSASGKLQHNRTVRIRRNTENDEDKNGQYGRSLYTSIENSHHTHLEIHIQTQEG